MAKLARSIVVALYVSGIFAALVAGAGGGYTFGYLEGYEYGKQQATTILPTGEPVDWSKVKPPVPDLRTDQQRPAR